MTKKVYLILGVSFILILGLSIFSIYYTSKITKEVITKEEKISLESQASYPKNLIIPADPNQYGMVVIEKDSSLEEFETVISKKIEELKSQYPQEFKNYLQEKDPVEVKEKIKTIQESIEECLQKLKENPEDEKLKTRLQRLIILRSIINKLYPQ
ncbi:MAG: hypothetical protein NC900_03065 [Candidatus Omnitrophica bacterium]|nr:hypothetical protein [Candidatus Omnitrophota bacterium]